MLHVIIIIIVVQSLSPVWLCATPWAASRQVSLFFTISQSVLKLMSIKSVMPSNHLILCRHLFLLLSIFPSIRVFFNESTFSSDGKSIRWPVSQLQHQSFQWIFRVFLFFSLWDWLAVQATLRKFSPAQQFESINSSVFSLLYVPTLTFMHEYWKTHTFDCTDLCWQNDVGFLILCVDLS